MRLSSTPWFTALLGQSGEPGGHRPGVRSLSWGVWAWSAPPRSSHPAGQTCPPDGPSVAWAPHGPTPSFSHGRGTAGPEKGAMAFLNDAEATTYGMLQ